MKLPNMQRRTTYGVFLAVWASGVLWWVLSRWFEVTGEFGPEPHPWQRPALVVHGFAAMLALLLLGALWEHIRAGLRRGWRRPSGLRLMVVCALLIGSGYGLYYLGDEQWRQVASNVHVVLGTLAPIALGLHVRARLRRRSASRERPESR